MMGPSLRSLKALYLLPLIAIILLCLRWFTPQLPNLIQKNTEPKLAYATLLLPDTSSNPSRNTDIYFLSTRILNYQLLHDKRTRTTRAIPFLVLVTSDIPPWKCDHLKREGATIVRVEKLDVDWIEPGHERWRNVMIKLRLFELLNYDRILFLDADTFLFKPLDGVFADPAAQTQQTLQQASIEPDEGPLPESYVFGTSSEVMTASHSYPPVPMGYFNAGFFVMSPSLKLFRYYLSLFSNTSRFDTTYPEQNLLNYAHREDRNMPWGRLNYPWNINLPLLRDVEMGVASVHAKLWTKGNKLAPIEQELQDIWRVKREEMEIWTGFGSGRM
ncbi:Meiotically up-regulated protein [Lachnellula subtilissima]|uniref:Meiotically up-regulated protein n=1 Tax=Lachnellula subtilissima TaxID=602034 RepID=A0A8H8U9G5_9HELO|nr:Meiotically up-regulated protein [Lachnellula subtilissima]